MLIILANCDDEAPSFRRYLFSIVWRKGVKLDERDRFKQLTFCVLFLSYCLRERERDPFQIHPHSVFHKPPKKKMHVKIPNSPRNKFTNEHTRQRRFKASITSLCSLHYMWLEDSCEDDELSQLLSFHGPSLDALICQTDY